MTIDRLQALYELRAKIDHEIETLERHRSLLIVEEKRQRRSRWEVPECGTETAYQRHRYQARKHGAPPLDPANDVCGCVRAHAEHNERKDKIARANKRAAERRAARQRMRIVS